MANDIKLGMIIKSKAGRDKNRYFMVYSYDGGNFVYLVDGVLRNIASPKKKKIKHIELTHVVLDPISQKLAEGTKVFDAEVRKAMDTAGFSNAKVVKKEE